MKHLIIGTAGHVDHGKSTLIRALTGINPDRLREEQERGMTIDLGFAWLDFDDGFRVGIVDVPGHERFLKNMLAGAGGVDVALLVVAADEGVMPQTREHLDVLRLLNVAGGVVALTKSDLVDEDLLALQTEEVRAALVGSPLEGAATAPVSAETGAGLNELKQLLREACDRAPAKPTEAPFRMPIDRVFSVAGFGTVVTGTVVSGTVSLGETVKILPNGLDARVRTLQVHNDKVDRVEAGQRAAINLSGVPKEKLERGQAVCAPNVFGPTRRMDVELTVLPDAPAPLKTYQRVRLHLGTDEVIARVLLPENELAPGETAIAQIRTERETVCARGDRFVIRRYSPALTLAGGAVLVPQAEKRRRAEGAAPAGLDKGPLDLVRAVLRENETPLTPAMLARMAGIGEAEADAAARELEGRSDAQQIGGYWMAMEAWETISKRFVDRVAKFHKENPIRLGPPREQVRGGDPAAKDPKLFEAILDRLVDEKRLAAERNILRLPDFQVNLNPKQAALLDRLEAAYRQRGILAPSEIELSRELGVHVNAIKELNTIGVELGRLVRVSPELVYHADTLDEIKQKVREWVQDRGLMTVGEFRDITQSSRKYAVPLIEYLDGIRFTRRVGDNRILG